jgi:hypothetical protein
MIRCGTPVASTVTVRTIATTIVIVVAFGLGGCASTSARLPNEVFLDLYWTASKQCEARYGTLHVDRIGVDGSLSVSAAADSRSEAQPFRECYWKAVRDRAEQRRAAGLTMPEDVNLQPEVDID